MWQFSIDVGGTFTDCVAVDPSGKQHRAKVLSSGEVPGTIQLGSSREGIVDPRRKHDPADFWTGQSIRVMTRSGEILSTNKVQAFDHRQGHLQLAQPLTSDPEIGTPYAIVADEEAPVLAMRLLTRTATNEQLPPMRVRLGTTKGTNALLTRSGANTAFVTTLGFADLLEIGNQNRPHLFDLNISKRAAFYSTVVEIDERVAADGTVLRIPDEHQVHEQLSEARRAGIESLAICFLHAHAYPAHEEIVGAISRELGFASISLSHRVSPHIKVVSRASTTLADAYLGPVIRDYITRLEDVLPDADDAPLRLLTSAGGLVRAAAFDGKDSILSGPAGGVVGFSRAAEAAGFDRAIGLDMGGTSCDVSRYHERPAIKYETETHGIYLQAPILDIETVAAGGGSICRFDGVKLVVGPDSAGADPGPACYGRGGPLCVTDMNVVLGRLVPDRFPFQLQVEAATDELANLAMHVSEMTGKQVSVPELAIGFLRIANTNMAHAVRSVSVAQGVDPRDYALVAFGGAGPQHACAVARELGMQRILIHPDGSLLSAIGAGLADVVRHRSQGIYRPLNDDQRRHSSRELDRLAGLATAEVRAEGIADAHIQCRRSLDLRYVGRDAYLTIGEAADDDYRRAFETKHQSLFGYNEPNAGIEIVAARVAAIGRLAAPPSRAEKQHPRHPTPTGTNAVYFASAATQTPLFDRHELVPGDAFAGPALVTQEHSTTVVEPGWSANVLSDGQLLLTAANEEVTEVHSANGAVDPVSLEVFFKTFGAIAEQMGVTLRNTASSVNVKERLDYSCAIFTPTGDLVVNAPHMPVHLGAMSETIRCVLDDHPQLDPGDVVVTNDPYRGGSHLPDITVVTPVFAAANEQLLFFTASRAHHAEIGGTRPGSMSPFATNLAEEGVLIRSMKVVRGGYSRLDELRELLTSGQYPSRDAASNLADVTAQIAANRMGAARLLRLVDDSGNDVVQAYMQHVQDAAETKTRQAIARLPNGTRTFADHMDDGSRIQVAVTIVGDTAHVDFSGSAGVNLGSLNANRAIVRAAVLYSLRCLVDEDIPLNEGIWRPVTLDVPVGMLAPPANQNPALCPAVGGGNVETSQRLVDVMLAALGLAAASQGTMNNLLFGDPSFGYYETICGGAGATPTRAGAHAVHTHMTNTRLTDPEVFESRYPVRLVSFRIRRGSGGPGRHPGGDGVVREIEFLSDLDVSLLSQRRGAYPPFGLRHGAPGQIGNNELIRRHGPREVLGGLAEIRVAAGDRLIIATPGGGGFGPVAS